MKPLRVQDETGQWWLVYPGDVAWTACRALHLQGVKELVLPRSLLLHGQLTMPPIPGTIDRMSAQNVTENPALAALFRRYVRLTDCVAYLNEASLASPGRSTEQTKDEDAPVGADSGDAPW